MEIKAELKYPYSEEQKTNFIVVQNHKLGYEIRKIEREIEEIIIDPESGEPVTDTEIVTRTVIDLEAWGLTVEEKEQQERERKDRMTLTPADVERALYKAKGMDFEDLKELILSSGTGIDPKALAIEFRAKDFYRGAMFGSGRLFDIVGAILGYDSDDIDYLFEYKELPEKVEEDGSEGGASDVRENAPSGDMESEE